MSEARDPLDEDPYDPLDESPMAPDDDLVKGGADPVEGFHGSLMEARERAGRLASRPGIGQAVSLRRRRAFLRALAQTGNVTLACAAAGWSPKTAYATRKSDKDFAEAWATATEVAADLVEAEMFRRAVHGVSEDVWHKPKEGSPEVIGQITRYSDSLMQTLVKGLKPEKYRERSEVKHDAPKGGVLLIPSPVPLDEWEAACARQQAKYREAPEETKP
jgi:hypothetical protein